MNCVRESFWERELFRVTGFSVNVSSLSRNNMLKMFKGDRSFIPKNISASQFMIVS